MSFDLRNKHTCDGLVRCCIDFRFWHLIVRYVEENFSFDGWDLSSEAGGVKSILDQAEREAGVKGILISCRLHSMKTIILVAHEDCGAYGGSKAFASADAEREFHIGQLHYAHDIIEEILQSKDSGCFDEKGEYIPKEYVYLYAHFSEDGMGVEIENVEKEEKSK